MLIKPNYYILLLLGALFTGGSLLGLMFPVLTKLYLIIVISMFVFSLYTKEYVQFQKPKDINIKVTLLLFILFYVMMAISTLINSLEQSGFYVLIKSLAYFLLFLVVFFSIDAKNVEKITLFYNKVILFLSYLGVIGFILVQNKLIPIIGQYNIGDRIYNFYFFTTSIDKDSILNIGAYSLTRLQSYYDEPGSFALMLIPTIIWYTYYQKYRIHKLILWLAMFLTFSIGGYITLIIILIYYYFKDKAKQFIVYLFLLTFFTFIFSTYVFEMLTTSSLIIDFISYKFGIGSYENEITSGGSRLEQIFIFIDILKAHPFGIGLENGAVFVQITPGTLRGIMATGWGGLLIALLLNLYILKISMIYANKGYLFHSSLGFMLVFQGLQRAVFFESFLGLLLFLMFLKKNYLSKAVFPKSLINHRGVLRR